MAGSRRALTRPTSRKPKRCWRSSLDNDATGTVGPLRSLSAKHTGRDALHAILLCSLLLTDAQGTPPLQRRLPLRGPSTPPPSPYEARCSRAVSARNSVISRLVVATCSHITRWPALAISW